MLVCSNASYFVIPNAVRDLCLVQSGCYLQEGLHHQEPLGQSHSFLQQSFSGCHRSLPPVGMTRT